MKITITVPQIKFQKESYNKVTREYLVNLTENTKLDNEIKEIKSEHNILPTRIDLIVDGFTPTHFRFLAIEGSDLVYSNITGTLRIKI